MSAKAETHIRALRRLIQELSNYQLDDVTFLIGEEHQRRQALDEAKQAAENGST